MSGLVGTYNLMTVTVCPAQQPINSFKLTQDLILTKVYNVSIKVPLEYCNFVFRRILWYNSSVRNL